MNRDQFQKWIDEHGTGQRENKSCNGIDWVLVTMKDTWIALFGNDGHHKKMDWSQKRLEPDPCTIRYIF